MITTSTFSQDAREYVKKIEKRIVLIDGKQLAQLKAIVVQAVTTLPAVSGIVTFS